ncbi:aminoglycoside phosphotransferase family protein [Kibdelosporangium phytohabitans]|uniref:aminoglycoside phosphotransferase family protein n=1 Tax=Kibdelosporangium phytohabitans TaxID=860235 RepID=UPI0012FB42FB|nr:aminoglycoside phosphotransferase family protein [Kibdelosporangium phytohabitans]MBE1462190.1 aminoglycoside phosphotransferase (APT) family kinase protein [Kibdelosporangium phytohabitans]
MSLAHRLIAGQFPQWAGLPVIPITPGGTDNDVVRLGDDMVVRLPRGKPAAAHIQKDLRWLGKLAPHLPLAIPVPLAHGSPSDEFPLPWAVYRWLPGHTATPGRLTEPVGAARALGSFVAALERIDASSGPAPTRATGRRGLPLAIRDADTRAAIGKLGAVLDVPAALAVWDEALAAPGWDAPGVWLHGDLHSGNLLAVDGRLSAVIDFGLLAVGDPAVDLMVAWTMFDEHARPAFRAATGLDEATWVRGRGWALSFAVLNLVHYLGTESPLVPLSLHALVQLDAAKARRSAANCAES